MGGSCCAPKIDYQGSVFYRKIDPTMEKTGKPDLDEVFSKADDPLQKAEEVRSKIAAAFKEMTTLTGTVVLKVPDLEQCVRSYLIKFLVELRKNAPTQGDTVDLDISKLDLQDLFCFSQQPPYLTVNEEKLKTLQSAFKCNPCEGELGKMKDSIVKFLQSLEGIKSVFDEYAKEVGEIKQEAFEFVGKLKYSEGVSEIYREIMIGKRNLQKILDMRSIIQVFGEVGNQISEAVEVFSRLYKDSSAFKQFDALAKVAIEKKCGDDMMKLVWETTNEAKLPKLEDWKDNFDYKIAGQVNTA